LTVELSAHCRADLRVVFLNKAYRIHHIVVQLNQSFQTASRL
jgi:hypothetical protein